MSTISGVAASTPPLSAYGVLRRDAQAVVGDVEGVAKAIGHGLVAGGSATGSAVASGLSAVGDTLSALGHTINTYV
ncbi:hypothetical protein [Aquitalea aquatica]|uniref:Uncharacterized protein n=1 Tax=Aquitalea aquatica TaxID=3044273 RepID=A0A838YBD5_9NEIS|nr:hypothetical protein [Aquitalea magnusonii]MBA4709859.1 hypothetical protein [Aquitalea magnusonii]